VSAHLTVIAERQSFDLISVHVLVHVDSTEFFAYNPPF